MRDANHPVFRAKYCLRGRIFTARLTARGSERIEQPLEIEGARRRPRSSYGGRPDTPTATSGQLAIGLVLPVAANPPSHASRDKLDVWRSDRRGFGRRPCVTACRCLCLDCAGALPLESSRNLPKMTQVPSESS